jgi:LysM repeat protein
VLLAVLLALSLAMSPALDLPSTAPGLGPDEGVFLTTTADDGSRAVYFVARGARHSIVEADMQAELRVNPLWPVRTVGRDAVLAYPEASPIGSARTNLITASVADSEPAEAAPAIAEVEPSTYVLKRGDTLTQISRAYGTTVDAILHANGISNPNRIYAGQALVIPIGDAPLVAHDEADAEAVAEEPSADILTHTVQRGESAIAIARRFGVDVEHLLAANNVADRNRIYAGQTLTIPGSSS